MGWASGRLAPPPSVIFATFVDLARTGELQRNTLVTLGRVAAGFGLGVAVATIVGAAAGYSPLGAAPARSEPAGAARHPSIAWVPLFILWLGIFEASKMTLIAVGVFFPVYLGVMGAIQSVDRKIVEVGRAFRLSDVADGAADSAAGGAAGLCDFAALRPWARLDVRRRRRTHGRVRRARLSADRRPAARQAGRNRRRHRRFRHRRQGDRLADRRLSPRRSCAGKTWCRPRTRIADMLVLERVGKTYPQRRACARRRVARRRAGRDRCRDRRLGLRKIDAVARHRRARSGKRRLDRARRRAHHGAA